jgi:kynureninase
MRIEPTEACAKELDANDPLASFREKFHIPEHKSGQPYVYLTGHSLGLQPQTAKQYIETELRDWARLGVEAHFHAENPWASYHELVTESLARLAGAAPLEVVAMNSISVNLHLMLTSFYRPTPARHGILVEGGAFPSDQYAVDSQIRFHGFSPEKALLELAPRPGEETLRTEDIIAKIEAEGDRIALILLGSVQYLTGQAFDIAAIAAAGRRKGCVVGFDLAHGIGNLPLRLHDDGVDFAVWGSYKYLNAGPGGVGGCFVHERHARDSKLPRFAGWWGHDKKTRWAMPRRFSPMPGAEGWALSNPPIFQLAALRASLEIFDAATMTRLRKKSELLTGYFSACLKTLPEGSCRMITPDKPNERGCQISFHVTEPKERLVKRLQEQGIICDVREPDVVRAAPVPLYNRFSDVYRLTQALTHGKTKAAAR